MIVPGLMVELQGVSKVFEDPDGAVAALDAVTVTVPTGGALVVTGGPAAGKSTLLAIVGGELAPTAGDIVVLGIALVSVPARERRELRRSIGRVGPDVPLVGARTVAENVGLPLALRGLARREIADRVEDALAAVGLLERAAAWPGALSAGERHAIELARALAVRPALLLLDEPYGGWGDDAARAADTLARQRARGTTLVLATRHPAWAGALGAECLVLEDGRPARSPNLQPRVGRA